MRHGLIRNQIKIRYKGFQTFAVIFLLAASFVVLFPFVLLIISSITEEATLMVNGYSVFPKKLSLEAYQYVFGSSGIILRSYGLSAIITAAGTAAGISITALMAYPLSRKDFKGKNAFTFFVFFTMLFNGGLVPQYILWSSILGVKNTPFALLLPNLLMTAFNVLLIRNYYKTSIPFEIIESAKIDGAGEWYTFYKIIIPMSTPILASIGLLIALNFWNDWMNGLYYINNPKFYTFQVLLNRMIQQVNFLSSSEASYVGSAVVNVPSISVRMAIAALGVVPIMMIYPFFQKYFAKGLALGAVKG